MKNLFLATALVLSSFVAGCAADDATSPATGGPANANTQTTDDSKLTTEREVGSCGTPLSPLTLTPRDDQPTGVKSFEVKVTAKGSRDSIAVLVANGGVDCDGGEMEAKRASEGDGFIDVALRFKRINGEPSRTLCRCSPDVKGTIKDLPAGHYELRVVRETLEGDKVVEEVVTPTSVGVDVGGG